MALDLNEADIENILQHVHNISNSDNKIVHKLEKLCETYDEFHALERQWRRDRVREKVTHELVVS